MTSSVYAFETDTVWGFGADINDSKAIEKIYELKNRDYLKPLILMGGTLDALLPYVKNIPSKAYRLMGLHFPGALTLVLEKSLLVPKALNPNVSTVGIRLPAHKGFGGFCKMNGNLVMATTSANISNETPCKNADEVREKFADKVEIITPSQTYFEEGKASTVVAFQNGEPIILRQGSVLI